MSTQRLSPDLGTSGARVFSTPPLIGREKSPKKEKCLSLFFFVSLFLSLPLCPCPWRALGKWEVEGVQGKRSSEHAPPPADSIRRCLSQGAVIQQHRVKLETKPKKFEDRVLVRAGSLGAGETELGES